MKHYILFLTVALSAHYSISQAAIQWAHGLGGNVPNAIDQAYSMSVDNEGNVYICGNFDGIMDADPSDEIYNIVCTSTSPSTSGYNGFVIKYSPTGSLIWASAVNSLTASWCRAIALDAQGNPIIIGSFNTSLDIDPSATENIKYANNSSIDSFVIKLNKTNGGLIWGFTYGNPQNDSSSSIKSDESGNFLIVGQLATELDFDPGAAVAMLGSSTPYTSQYLVKYNEAGEYLWAKEMCNGSASGDIWSWGHEIDLDLEGNVIICRNYYGTADFDPSEEVYEIEGNPEGYADVYLAKYSGDGDFIWARSMGGSGTDEAHCVTTDADGNIYIAGNFDESGDFDPGVATQIFTSNNDTQDIFFSKFDTNGNLIWTHHIGGPYNDDSRTLVLDNNGHLFLGGLYYSEVDINAGDGVFTLDGGFGQNFFVAVYDTDGHFMNVSDYKSSVPGCTEVLGDLVLFDDQFYMCGFFDYPLDMDCSDAAYIITTTDDDDLFIGKYTVDLTDVAISEIENKHMLIVSPNPCRDKIQISNNNINSSKDLLRIYSPFGELMVQQPWQLEVDVSSLPCGIYLIQTDNSTAKFIKE